MKDQTYTAKKPRMTKKLKAWLDYLTRKYKESGYWGLTDKIDYFWDEDFRDFCITSSNSFGGRVYANYQAFKFKLEKLKTKEIEAWK